MKRTEPQKTFWPEQQKRLLTKKNASVLSCRSPMQASCPHTPVPSHHVESHAGLSTLEVLRTMRPNEQRQPHPMPPTERDEGRPTWRRWGMGLSESAAPTLAETSREPKSTVWQTPVWPTIFWMKLNCREQSLAETRQQGPTLRVFFVGWWLVLGLFSLSLFP